MNVDILRSELIMESEQLELMKVIQFPKNKIKENRDRIDKLEVAYKVLKYLVEEGKEFHIVVTKESAEELFEIPSSKYNYVTITSSLGEADNIKLHNNTFFYPILGDEF